MKRPKKISISYYANTKLKPEPAEHLSEDHEIIPAKGEHYPVYVSVNFNGSNTKFRYVKTIAGLARSMPTSEIDGVKRIMNKALTQNTHVVGFEKEIEAIVRYEDSISFNKKYSLKGLSSRFYFYDSPVEEFLIESIMDDLNKYLSSSEDTKEGRKFIGLISDVNLFYGFSLIEKQLPSFIKQMPSLLKNKIVTLIAIQLFEFSSYNSKKEGSIPIPLRWYDYKFERQNKQFLDFLKNWNWQEFHNNNNASDYNEKIIEEIKLLSQTFPIQPIEVLTYLNILEDLAYLHLREYK